VPLAIIATVGFALTLWAGITFVLVLVAGGIAYELWTNGRRWTHRANSFAIGPSTLLAVAAGAITVSLTATIFFDGLKAGLLTFGGAYTVIPFPREAAVENHHWLTSGQFNDGLAMGGVLPGH
jgi:chromate transporter